MTSTRAKTRPVIRGMSIRRQSGHYKVRRAASRSLVPLLAPLTHQTPRRRRPPSTLPSVGAIVETREPANGPISPELVLVDPDLAARARAALPDHPWPAPARIASPTPTLQRRIPVAAIFSFLSFGALVGILGISLLPSRDQPTFAAEGQRIQPTAPSPTAGARPQPAADQRNPRRKRRGALRRPAAKPAPSERASCRDSNPLGRSPGCLRRVRPTTRSPSSETAGASTRGGLAPPV